MTDVVRFHRNVDHGRRYVRMVYVVVVLGTVWDVHGVLLVFLNVLQDLAQVMVNVGVVIIHGLRKIGHLHCYNVVGDAIVTSIFVE